MAKLTINEREFESGDFNEEQTQIYNTLVKYLSLAEDTKYKLMSLESAAQLMANTLIDKIDNKDADAAVNEAEA